ncbi:MAG: outer membrane beta-barrel protein [Prolixibacteraceae bacterium]|nr:outer membrane beta-barrel protein [Prolixibacteraceae bacterium]
MKYITSFIKRRHRSSFSQRMIIGSLIIGAAILTCVQAPLQAQDTKYTKPSWYFGVAGGANVNFYRGTTQMLNSALTVPSAFYNGNGVGLFVAPLIEYHRPNTRLGLMLQLGYDGRKGKFDQVLSPCNCPEDLKTNLSYFTIEPSLRFAPFKSDFYLYAGPRFAFNTSKSFTYQQGTNPAYPLQVADPEVKGDFSDVRNNLVSLQIGAGYDIPITSQKKHTQFVISPFVSFHPYFGQDPRTVESWNLTTLRAGIALKLGRGHVIEEPLEVLVPPIVVVEPEVQFTLNAPKNIVVERRVRETFPLRNYVFFNGKSTQIPDRYVLLRKDQVKDFKEEQLEVFTPKELSGRAQRQMTVYYNVLNILGDRMSKNPSTVVVLTGSSLEGPKVGKQMAESVKIYLVDVFGIDGSRISVEGRVKPKIPSEQPWGTKELVLLREGDNRVSIMSESPALMMEFQSGPDVPMKPVEIVSLQEAPLDSYVTFNVDGADKAFTSWSLVVVDEQGQMQYFGPFTKDKASLPGKSILGTRSEGDYKVTMIGQTKSGKVVKKEASAHMVLWAPPKTEEMMRFSIIYEFNNAKAIGIYDKYLTEVVIPKIPNNAKVIIHGHTDIIGEKDYNQKLSVERANDVRTILEKGLAKAGRSDVKFEVYGFGEDLNMAPFDNKYPEERFYNRTVVIDIVPAN